MPTCPEKKNITLRTYLTRIIPMTLAFKQSITLSMKNTWKMIQNLNIIISHHIHRKIDRMVDYLAKRVFIIYILAFGVKKSLKMLCNLTLDIIVVLCIEFAVFQLCNFFP